MANATITGTASNFGSISGVLAGEAGTVAGTITGVVTGSLTGSVGVPGPQGPAGATGAQGPAGQGVPTGGTAGQVLAKIDGTNYNTEWVDVSLAGYRTLTDFDFSNVVDAPINIFAATLQPPDGVTETYNSRLDSSFIRFGVDASNSGAVDGVQNASDLYDYRALIRTRTWTSGVADAGTGIRLEPSGILFTTWNNNVASSTMQIGRTSVTFPNGSVQTIAFPGFNNAALTGNPTAPTAATGDNDTSIATTAFVQQELAAGTAVAKNLEVYVRNQTGATLTAGTIVYINGATGNRPTVTKAQANNDANSAQTFGFVKASIANNGFGYVIVRGELENVDTSALTEGQQLYLSPTTAGTWTTTKPYAPDHLVYVGICVRAHPTQGVILVAIQNGYELDEIHDVKITSPSNGQVLKYDSAQGLWVNGTDSAPVTSVAGKTGAVTLSNTDISGLGTMATATATDYLAKAGNLSGLADLATSRTNLGLGTMATETASNYLTTSAASSTYAPLASPAMTGTPTAPTAAANTNTTQVATTAFVLGQGNSTAATIAMNGTQAAGTSNLYARADHVHPTDTSRAPLASPALTGTPTAPTASSGTNTTQIATTAFVQQEVPAASTTAAGKVELATINEALDGSSTTLVPTVEDVVWMLMNEAYRPYFNITGGTSGTGASLNLVPPFRYEIAGPNAGVAGNAYAFTNNWTGMSDGYISTTFDFNQKCWISFGLDNLSSTWVGDANNEIKVFWGFNVSSNGDDPTDKAIGIWKQGGTSSVWNLMVHNGTTLTKVATSTTMPTGQLQRFTVYSNGSGTVKLYINGTEVASTTSGPTGTRDSTRFWASVKQTASASTRILNMIFYPKVYAQP